MVCALWGCQKYPLYSNKRLRTHQASASTGQPANPHTATPLLDCLPTTTHIYVIYSLRVTPLISQCAPLSSPLPSPPLPSCLLLPSSPLPSCLLLPIPGSTSLYRFLPWLIGSRATLIGPASVFAFTRSCCMQRNTYMDITPILSCRHVQNM